MTSDAMAAVAAKFRASLACKADEIEAAHRACKTGGPVWALVALMHKLAGSAGFYAETAIAELAADLERRLDPARNGGAGAGAGVVTSDIERLVALLRARSDESVSDSQRAHEHD